MIFKRNRTWQFILISMMLNFWGACGGWAAPEVPNLDAEIAAQETARNDLNKKIQQYNETAKRKAEQAQGLLGRITGLQQNSKLAQQQIKLLELQSNKLQKSMSALNRDMAETERKVKDLVAELRSRVVNMYKYGSREELNLLLSAENTHEAISSAYLLERLARRDQIIIDELLNRMAQLEQSKRNLEKNKTQLSVRTQELGAQREKYNSSISETSAILSDVQREKKKAEQAAAEMEQAQREIGRTILSLMQKKKARPAEAESRAGAEGERNYMYLARGSMLDWPIKGSIAAPFGSRVHPVFKTKSFNSGIDIRAAANAPVSASGPGEVLFQGWLRGFGEVIIIDHGRNISTVYAHLASAKVKEGDSVKPGMLIGTVGNTGTTEGYSLHFEVRVGDAAKNPLEYLKKL